ncbi:MAG TPA: AAA family ATPase, partial [bacterium]|nr:AAA family ATPase [bacterium]
LKRQLDRVREIVELPLKYPELFDRLGIDAPKGVLLYGPPGTGKTTIARAVASEVKAHFIRINGPEIIHKFYGESEAKLREIFEEAQRKAPSIIFIDEIDAIAPKRSDVAGEVEKRVVAQLLALMDGMVSRGEVVVIGATNLPELLDHALRRPGRFDREVVVRVPNRPGRLQILRIHGRGMPLAEDVDLERLAEVTHGFVGADLEVLCKEAGMAALQDVLDREDFAEREIAELAQETRVHMRHFLAALKGIEPTATREFFAERPNVHWSDVGGLDDARSLLRSTVELPRRFPRLYRAAGSAAPNGVMLSGAPGTGKTLLVRALATESGFSFITVDAAALFSKWVGESEKALRQVFIKARQASPCILFFDEVDTIFPRRGFSQDVGGRERLIGQFLAEMGGLEPFSEVMVIAATNRLDLVEPALLSPGRFSIVIELPLPSPAEREAILGIHLK